MEIFLEIARCRSCKPQNLRGEDAGVIDGEVDDLVPGVLLEHQLHLGKLDAPNLSSCCEADRLLGGLHTRLLPQELLNLDLAFWFVTVDHVASQDGLVCVFVFTHHDDVHVNEADLLNALQLQRLHMVQLRLIVKHVKAVLSRDGYHVQVFKHGEGESLLVLHAFGHTVQLRDRDLLNDLLALQVNLRQFKVTEKDEAALVDRVHVYDLLVCDGQVSHILESPVVVVWFLALEDRFTEK